METALIEDPLYDCIKNPLLKKLYLSYRSLRDIQVFEKIQNLVVELQTTYTIIQQDLIFTYHPRARLECVWRIK